MKIAVLVDQVAQAGGLERSLALKVGAWRGAGHAIEIITLERGTCQPFYTFPEGVVWRHLGIDYQRTASLLSLRNVLMAVRHFWRLSAALRSCRADVVIHCGYGYDFYFVPILAGAHAFLIKENHSSRASQQQQRRTFSRLKNRLRHCVEERYDVCVFLSSEEAAMAGVRNAVVIPNPAANICILERSRAKVVIAAGRICHVKGFDRLLEAWAIASSSLPGWVLEIYGDGTDSDVSALRRQLVSLKLVDRVRIESATSDILLRIAGSSLFALSSRTECFPMVLLESMQLGVPVIAFDCPTGPRNIITHGVTGHLVPDGDVEAFAAALVKLAKDARLRERLAHNARREVQRYSLSDINDLWHRLFKRACSS